MSAVTGAESGFLFDANRCTGCAACSLACSTENALGWGVSWRQIVSFNPGRRLGVPSFHLSLACNHCDDAPCVAQCPTHAMHRDEATGAVLVDAGRCIGCRYCAWVCPYDAPRFDQARGVMSKCTLCSHRLADGCAPACVEACPTDALEFGPLAGETRIPGLPATSARPRIRFAPLRRGARPPEATWSLPPEVLAAYGPGAYGDAAARGRDPATLSLGTEWPLWVFTSGLAALVGWVGAAGVGAVRLPITVFVGATLALLASSALHLGRPLRAWRALANVRMSALSREIAGVAAFSAVATLWLAWGGGGASTLLPGEVPPAWLSALGVAAFGVGLLTLTAVDRVYRALRELSELHSADTLLTAPLVAGALVSSSWAYGLLALLKLALAARGRDRSPRDSTPPMSGAAPVLALRCAALAGPLALWALAPGAWNGWALLLVAAAELLDRARFYMRLSIPGPRSAARAEADAWVVAEPATAA